MLNLITEGTNEDFNIVGIIECDFALDAEGISNIINNDSYIESYLKEKNIDFKIQFSTFGSKDHWYRIKTDGIDAKGNPAWNYFYPLTNMEYLKWVFHHVDMKFMDFAEINI